MLIMPEVPLIPVATRSNANDVGSYVNTDVVVATINEPSLSVARLFATPSPDLIILDAIELAWTCWSPPLFSVGRASVDKETSFTCEEPFDGALANNRWKLPASSKTMSPFASFRLYRLFFDSTGICATWRSRPSFGSIDRRLKYRL